MTSTLWIPDHRLSLLTHRWFFQVSWRYSIRKVYYTYIVSIDRIASLLSLKEREEAKRGWQEEGLTTQKTTAVTDAAIFCESADKSAMDH